MHTVFISIVEKASNAVFIVRLGRGGRGGEGLLSKNSEYTQSTQLFIHYVKSIKCFSLGVSIGYSIVRLVPCERRYLEKIINPVRRT